jgi:hypothetical protein
MSARAKRMRSRHTYDADGRETIRGPIAPKWLFLQSRLFWVIATVVTLLHLAVFWAIKDVTVFEPVKQYVFEPLRQTFWVEETSPDYSEEGKLLKPGEKRFTVPSALVGEDR